ncbi:MAG: outer membrane lipoprotein chaperone LolA [Bryobacteraceae bacterium]|nr:outer membrane lipoprotein chaperone LolA [Bryobacteraceae bacterium]
MPRRILHVPARRVVNIVVKVLCLLALLCPLTAADLKSWIGTVERRYNSARTMEAAFEQTYLAQGRKRVERGQLSLRKSGRMRWEYTEPAGKLFIADGKWVWMYSPATGKAERAKLKASDDERAPLAFLLGKLDFSRLFRDFELAGSGETTVIRALPKSDKVPYTSVEFSVGPQGEIRRLKVTNGDGSITEYSFTSERLNGAVADAKFRFTPPPGVAVEEITEGGER